MEETFEDKQKSHKHTLETTEQLISELDPTTLIDIEFYKTRGLWDEEISKKFDQVVNKWEKIKSLTDHDKKSDLNPSIKK